MNRQQPEISVIVPVFNSEGTIDACLESLLNQDFPSYEIIIVNDGSTDKTAQICQAKKGVQIIETTNGGPSRARNIGVKKAAGEFVAFTDGDCIVHQQWLTELRKGFLRKEIASVGGDQISPENESRFGKNVQETFVILGFATSYMKTQPNMAEIRHNPSCNSAYRKSVFETIGGFEESLWPGEDVDLDCRLTQQGCILMRNPKAIVKHFRPQSPTELRNMMQRYGGSAYLLLRKYGFFRTLHYIPFLLLAAIVAVLLTAIFSPSVLLLLPLLLLTSLLFFFINKGFSLKSLTILFLSLFIVFHWHLGFLKQVFLKNPQQSQDKR